MTGYTPSIPANPKQPYKHMLKDIEQLIAVFKQTHSFLPTYIIIHEDDRQLLLNEMYKAKQMPVGHQPKKLQYMGYRIIQSPDIDVSYFDVVGN